MADIFTEIINMSITASYLAVAVIIIRAVFRKMPRWISCALWGLVGLRLILPFSFESIFSLIPSAETIPSDFVTSSSPHITSGIPVFNHTVNPIIEENFTPDMTASVNPLQVLMFILTVIWILGIIGMLLYAFISFIIVKRKTRESIKTEKGVYISDGIDTPFILGVFSPKIFIPSYISGGMKEVILSHERAHIKRGDHIWKPLSFLILSVYWFNPIMWAVFVLLCRDIEEACDEKVIKTMDTDRKMLYSEALISCSSPKRYIKACPLAFGETGVKSRIKNVLSYKKPALWIIIAALTVSIVLTVCFMTNPKGMGISDIEHYGNIYNEADKAQLYIGTGYIYTNEDASEIIREVKKVRLEKTPADQSRDENRDKSFRIEFDDSLSINIDQSFTYLWLDDMVKPSFTYKIKNPEILKDLFSISNYVSGVEGIYITVDKVTTDEDSMNFEVTWHNERDEEVTFGERYSIEKYNDEGLWEIYSFPEDFAFIMIGYLLQGNSEKTEDYYCPVRLSDGLYRFSSDFTFNNETYYARTTFTVGDTVSSFGGADGPTNVLNKKQLTLTDVIRLSKKGKELSWEDFDEFSYIETGSGLYIRVYKIDERFSLTIGGGGVGTEPMYMYLTAPEGGAGNFIDIRGDDVEAFIEENKDNPILEPEISFAKRTFPVDKTGNHLGEIIKYGAYVPGKLYMSSIRYLPVIRIENQKGLERFRDFFTGTFDFDMTLPDTELSFSQVYDLYEGEYEGFFSEYNLLIVYVSAGNDKDRFDTLRLRPYNGTLCISLRHGHYEAEENDSPTGWLMVLEVPKGPLQEITKIEAFVEETVSLPEPEITSSFYYKPYDEKQLFSALHLYGDGTFMFSPSVYSSYLGRGEYKYEGDLLILTSREEGYCYTFEVNNGYLVYKKDASIVHPSFNDTPDKAQFTEQ